MDVTGEIERKTKKTDSKFTKWKQDVKTALNIPVQAIVAAFRQLCRVLNLMTIYSRLSFNFIIINIKQ